jgi:hypothetical protein
MQSETYVTPITHGGANRGYKLCKCSVCAKEEVCTPNRDFYVVTEDGPEGPLYCEDCFRTHCSKSHNAKPTW